MEDFIVGEYATYAKGVETITFLIESMDGGYLCSGGISFNSKHCKRATGNEINAITVKEKSILDKAKEVIDDREQGYGTVKKNFDTIASFWTTYLNGRSTIHGGDIGMLMALMKIARQANGHKEDNLVDIAGYARCTEKYELGL